MVDWIDISRKPAIKRLNDLAKLTRPSMDDRLMRFPQVIARVGLCRSSIYNRIRAGEFPQPFPIGKGRAVGFLTSEIEGWIHAISSARGAQ